MGQKTLAYNQIGATALASAVGLGNGLSTLATATLVSGGSKYLPGDHITLSGGTSTFKAILEVLQVDGNGAVVTFQIANGGVSAGVYTSHPTGTLSTTTNSAAGSGATFTATWNANAIPAGTSYAIIEAEAADVRFTTDGQTTPTSSVGMLLKAASSGTKTDFLAIQGGDVARFQGILASGSPILNVTFFRS